MWNSFLKKCLEFLVGCSQNSTWENNVVENDDDDDDVGNIGCKSEDFVLRSKLKEDDKMLEMSLDSSSVSNLIRKREGLEKRLDSMLLNPNHHLRFSRVHCWRKLLFSLKLRNAKIKRLKRCIEREVKLVQRHHLLRSQKKGEEHNKLQDWVEECFTPLTKEEEVDVGAAFSDFNGRKVLVTHQDSNIDITVEKFKCLRPYTWLNDEVINVYLELLKEREKREPAKFLKCHFFNTFFFKKLISGKGNYNFQSIQRWTTQRKLGYSLLECEKIFVPIHQLNHWCLAIINNNEQKFQYLDSLGEVNYQVLEILARYYVDEVWDKIGEDIDVSSWERELVKDLPKQKNGYDCGVFMIKYADFYSRDIAPCFSQKNMPYFRKRTAKEILKLVAE